MGISLDVNWLAVAVASIAQLVLGMIWYSPGVFGKMWMKLAKVKPKKPPASTFIWAFVGGVVMAYVIARVVQVYGAVGIGPGAYIGALLGVGLIWPVLLGGTLWEGKPCALVNINSAYWVAATTLTGAILAAWP